MAVLGGEAQARVWQRVREARPAWNASSVASMGDKQAGRGGVGQGGGGGVVREAPCAAVWCPRQCVWCSAQGTRAANCRLCGPFGRREAPSRPPRRTSARRRQPPRVLVGPGSGGKMWVGVGVVVSEAGAMRRRVHGPCSAWKHGKAWMKAPCPYPWKGQGGM